MTTIEHRHLRSALEYAVLIAAEGHKRRPPLPFPKELKPFLGKPRLATSSFGRIRRAVEADPDYRAAISAGAIPDLVDDVGRLWLAGRPGWEDDAAQVIAKQAAAEQHTDLRRELKRAEKRRLAAEQATARIQVEVMQREAALAAKTVELDDLRADLAKAVEALEEVRAELIDTRNEARHARDREAAAVEKADALAQRSGDEPTQVADVEVDEIEPGPTEALILAQQQLADVVDASREFVERIESISIPISRSMPRRPARAPQAQSVRQALPLPGGLISTSADAARHLVRQRAPVLVDGYNVAKLAWPERSLEEQRETLIARCENFARRSGAEVTLVFDGSSVPGAHARRRRTIRIVYSPAGATADDVIRAEVDRVPDDGAVIVVTNDREIIDDVKAVGANVIPSNAFIAVF